MTRKYPVYFAVAEDHHSFEGTSEESAKERAVVWGFGIQVPGKKTGITLAMGGAKFESEEVKDSASTDLLFLRRPCKARRIAEVEF